MKIIKKRFFSIAVAASFILGFIFAPSFTFNSQRKMLDWLRSCEQLPQDSLAFETSEKFACYRRSLSSFIEKFGLEATVEAFRKYQNSEEGSILSGSRCHALGHEIGSKVLQKGYSNKEILSGCVNFCKENIVLEGQANKELDFGCLNGAAHAYVLINKFSLGSEKFCEVEGIPQEVKLGCYHGIGHGAVSFSKLNIEEGLALCSKLPSQDAKYQCGHAVLMDPDHAVSGPVRANPLEMASFCDRVEEVYKASCYEFSGFLTLARTRSVEKSLSGCSLIPQDYSQDCRQRVGEALFLTGKKTPEGIAALCRQAKGLIEQKDCIEGAVNTSIFGPDSSNGELAIKICSAAPEFFKRECFGLLGVRLEKTFGTSARKETCSKVEPSFRKDCEGSL